MTSIDEKLFAQKIEEYLVNQNSFNEDRIEEALKNKHAFETVDSVVYGKETSYFDFYQFAGIRFGGNTGLVMQLLKRAYDGLAVKPDVKEFSQSMTSAMQYFAKLFKEEDRDAHLCYPHFLLHGINKPSLEEAVDKFRNNARIIHETIDVSRELIKKTNHSFMKKWESGEREICENYCNMLYNGLGDDYFGISYCILHSKQITIGSGCGYVAKTSFLLDQTNKDLYVILIQGGRFGKEGKESGAEERRRRWNEIQKVTGKDPRTLVLMKIKELGKELGMKRIRVIKPEHHPMFIEGHKGFTGKYELVIRNAGINIENECYLEEKLE
jgi:hypothetical protein